MSSREQLDGEAGVELLRAMWRIRVCEERVGAPFAPIPFSPPLEDAYLPGREEVAAVRRTAGRV